MIKLKPLLERISSKQFDDESGRNYLVSNYEDAFGQWISGNILYRGHFTKNIYEEVYPSEGERQSLDTSNIYTVLLSKLPSWKGWPQRSHSLIFSDSINKAGEFGSNISYVFPDKNAKIVISPGPDLFLKISFPFLSKQTNISVNKMAGLADILSHLDYQYKYDWKKIGYENDIYNLKKNEYEHFINHLQTIATTDNINKLHKKLNINSFDSEKIFKNSAPINIINAYLKNYTIHKGNWEKFLDFLLNPKSNGFKLISLSKLNTSDCRNFGERHEMWTDSNCMLININEEQYLKKLGKAIFA